MAPRLMAVILALTVTVASVASLPITSRPIEGNAQRMAWEDWINLAPEQRTLEKEKKVTAKSIFTLPYRNCPQNHTFYKDQCILISHIDNTDVIKQELLLAGAVGGKPPPPPIADYDYGDGDGDSSGESLYDLSEIQQQQQQQQQQQEQPFPIHIGGLGGGSEDQALPSENAPLKFNIFEKFPTGTGEPEAEVELEAEQDMVGSSGATLANSTTSISPEASSTTPAGPAPAEALGNNRIAGGDLMAAPSNAMSTTTTLTEPSSNSSMEIGQVEAIVVPAGQQPQDGSAVQLVTSSLIDSEPNADADADKDANGRASANLNANKNGNPSANANANAEADLAQLLKVDAFLPASQDASIELMPPLFSHRRVAPPLSAVLDVKTRQQEQDSSEEEDLEEEQAEETTTDIVPAEGDEDEEWSTTVTVTVSGETTDTSDAEAFTEPQAEPSPEPHPPAETKIDEHKNHRLVLIKSKVEPVQVTTTAAAAAAADVAGSSTDRFHYQHFVETSPVPGEGSTTASSSSSTTTLTTTTARPLIMQNDDNDNLMTNTIGGKETHDDAEDVVAKELRLINALVKGSKRKQQQQQLKQQPETSELPLTTEESHSSSSSASSSFSEAASSSTVTNWSKVMPQLSQSSISTTETATAAATAAVSIANESSTAATATATAATSIATSTEAEATAETPEAEALASHLSINNRSHRNSKIIRVEQAGEEPAAAAAATVAANSDGYTPFWWLPNIGWSVERQLDRNGEDRSLLLRFFSSFGGARDQQANSH